MAQEDRVIHTRLRPRQDKDLINAVSGLSRGELSDYVRDGLRQVLFHRRSIVPAQIITGAIEEIHVNNDADSALDDMLGKF